MKRVLTALTLNRAETDPASPDRRLRGRTYTIPFERVWTVALGLADGGMRGWRLAHADDQTGVIEAVSRTLVFRFEDDVHIDVRLDENAQTRVDARSVSRVGRGDLGRNTRTIGRFIKRLDRGLAVRTDEVLDPTRMSAWTEES